MVLKLCKILLVMVLVGLAGEARAEKKPLNIYEEPRDLPAKYVYGERGNHVQLADFKGEFLIVVFWSRYCGPCLRELKDIAAFYQKTRYDGIRLVMVSPKKEWTGGFEEQQRFLKKFGAEGLEIYVDDKSELTSALGIFSSPVSVLINGRGQEIGRIRGLIDWDSKDVLEEIYSIKAEHG